MYISGTFDNFLPFSLCEDKKGYISFINIGLVWKDSAIIFFNLIDKFINQKRILNYLKNCDFKINTLIDVGAHKGLYSDLLMKHFSIKKTLMFEPQKEIYKYLKKKYKKNTKVFIFNQIIKFFELFTF